MTGLRNMSTTKLHISGEYPADWDAIGDRVRAEADHRCVRCGHRYKTGENGNGEWSPCDHQCTHAGPLGKLWRGQIIPVEHGAEKPSRVAELEQRAIYAQWRILTVHHLTGDKSNCEWWNCLPLCQRCHLTIQTRVNPEIPYFLEHSDWFKPYVAGYYAHKYEGRQLSRTAVMTLLDELLAYERLA